MDPPTKMMPNMVRKLSVSEVAGQPEKHSHDDRHEHAEDKSGHQPADEGGPGRHRHKLKRFGPDSPCRIGVHLLQRHLIFSEFMQWTVPAMDKKVDHDEDDSGCGDKIDDMVDGKGVIGLLVGTCIDIGKIEKGERRTDQVADGAQERQLPTHGGPPF